MNDRRAIARQAMAAALISCQYVDQMKAKGFNLTVVLIGEKTWQCDAVAYDIEQSLNRATPNGVLGIRLHHGVKVPDALRECGAEILGWKPDEFVAAISRAAIASRRPTVAAAEPGGSAKCIR